jgi:hypothetical protein
MIRKRGGISRRLTMLASVGGSIADLTRGLWHSDSGKRWILATTVEALAPFIYAIF